MKNIVFYIISILFTLSGFAQQDSTIALEGITIHSPSPNLDQSLAFYKKLNYQVVSAQPTLVTDGKMLLEINPDVYARAGVKFYKSSWAKEVELLKKLTTVYLIEKGYMVNDFNGCMIYLIEGQLPIKHTPKEVAYGSTGNFMGMSLESAHMAKSLEIWKVLGFSITMGSVDKGFIIIANSTGFSISMMKPLTCPHLFFNPSLTFFNGKENIEVIEKIKQAQISITEEITHFNKEGIVDNIIIRDPGGLGFFIFSD